MPPTTEGSLAPSIGCSTDWGGFIRATRRPTGKPAVLRREGGFCSYGSLPQQLAATPAPPGAQSAPELTPALHCWLLPDEVHLSALKEADSREITLHLRCVGSGQVAGRLRISAPAGLKVEPAIVEVPALGEGPERTV